MLKGAPWLDANWPYISTFLCPIFFLLPLALTKSPRQALQNPYVLGWLPVAFYCWHQTEEHAHDLRGWRYAFVPNFNHTVGALLFKSCETIGHLSCPLNTRLTLYVNVMVVWVGFVGTMVSAHYLGGPYVFAGLVNWGMSVVNAFGGHLLPFLFMGYNPGAFQSLFMFLFGIYAISRGGRRLAVASIVNGVLFHIITFGVGTNLVLVAHWPEELMAVLSVVGTWPMPLLVARYFAPRQYDKLEDLDDSETTSRREMRCILLSTRDERTCSLIRDFGNSP